MESSDRAVLQAAKEAIGTFLKGDASARLDEPIQDPELEAFRTQLNEVLTHCGETAEEFHSVHMRMADALTDWFECFNEVKRGNLDVQIENHYGDDFLDMLSSQINETVSILKDLDEERNRQKQQLIEQQAKMIQELSTPIIRVWDHVLALPIIGVVDSMRAKDMMEILLQSIVDNQARCVIIDLTGVTLIDTKTVDYLIKMVQAATLVGSQSIVTGINPEIAQTIARMGLDLEGVVTLRDLRAGLRRAFEILELEVTASRGA